jgi:hypothetical protein
LKTEVQGECRYVEGFLDGQAVAYCERVRVGAGVAAQLVCPGAHAQRLLGLVKKEGCKAKVARHTHGRVSIWIYRHETVWRLIERMQSASRASALSAWSMGKLFGYSDHDVIAFINRPK